MINSKILLNDVKKDKGVMFFSASSFKDAMQLYNSGIRDILVSYHYLKKNFKNFIPLMETITNEGGCFMTDSGAFSLFSTVEDSYYEPTFWTPYLEEYTKFIKDNHKNIYCCANLDLDSFVGQECVDQWNKKYFEPLEDLTQVVYIVHASKSIDPTDIYGYKRFKQYALLYNYVGIGSKALASYDSSHKTFYALAKNYNVRIHGFGWTRIPSLKSAPFFSVDSTTWLGGVRYGTSYRYDGKNFNVKDHKHKWVRKIDKNLCAVHNIDHSALLREERDATNKYNLVGWLGARREYLRSANTKLTNKAVSFYDKRNK